MVSGIVIEMLTSTYRIDTDRGIVEAAVRGALARLARVYPGDRVDVDVPADGAGLGTIVKVHERTSLLPRPAIANVGRILLVVTLREPALAPSSIDKCLFAAGIHDLGAAVIFNKADLLDRDERQALGEMARLYGTLGYPTLICSARADERLDGLVDLCAGKISCLAGVSGVGKTTLLSRIFPDRDFRTAELSQHLTRGRHTTSVTSLLRINDGYIADTPGFSLMSIPDVEPESVMPAFPEMAPLVGKCRFNNCAHADEPGCALKQMVEAGAIAKSRYQSYLEICGEIRARVRTRHEGRRPGGRARPSSA